MLMYVIPTEHNTEHHNFFFFFVTLIPEEAIKQAFYED